MFLWIIRNRHYHIFCFYGTFALPTTSDKGNPSPQMPGPAFSSADPKAVSSRIPGHKPSLNGPCPLEDESTRPAKAGGYNSRFHPGPPNSFPFIGSPFAAYTSLRFAGVATKEHPPRDPAVFAPPKAVSRTLHTAAAEIVLRCAGSAKRGLLGAERFASSVGRSLPRG